MNTVAAIPLLGDRVAPLCNYSGVLLVVWIREGKLIDSDKIECDPPSYSNVVKILRKHRVQVFACGGIERDYRNQLEVEGIRVICNVTGHVEDIIQALCDNRLKPWFGYETHNQDDRTSNRDNPLFPSNSTIRAADLSDSTCLVNCLACRERTCRTHQGCITHSDETFKEQVFRQPRMHSYYIAGLSGEPISRVEELGSYCQRLQCRKVGMVFCTAVFEDMNWIIHHLETDVLVLPICCQFGRRNEAPTSGSSHLLCDTQTMVLILNDSECDLIVTIGLCRNYSLALDRQSRAPVVTIIGKDTVAGGTIFPEAQTCDERFDWRVMHCLQDA